jgi:hypothetical protein
MKILGSIVGWVLMVVTVVVALFVAVGLTQLHRTMDGGLSAVRTTGTVLWVLPALAMSSGALLFWSRREWSRRVSPRFYWLLLAVPFSVWCTTAWYFQTHPVRRWHRTQQEQQEMDRAIDEWSKAQSSGANSNQPAAGFRSSP